MPDQRLFVYDSMAAIVKTISIATSFVSAGGIAALSLFDVELLKSQPAERSLPLTRYLFSRGSHIFPATSIVSASGFVYLAYAALPPADKAWRQAVKLVYFNNGRIVNGYLAAALLCFAIGPYTRFSMLPTNFALIEMNESKGGAKSAKTANEVSLETRQGRTADESVEGKGETSEYEDTSGPQEKTPLSTTEQENEKVRKLLDTFGQQNLVRASLMALGGVVGTVTAVL